MGGNHLTVKYGLKAADDDQLTELKQYLASLAPFEATLGKTEKFAPSEHSDGAAVINAPIEAKELHQINQELEQYGDFKKSDFGEYKPHATVAYVKPQAAGRYVGMNVTAGKKFTVNEIAISDRDGRQELVKLQGKATPTGTKNAPAKPRTKGTEPEQAAVPYKFHGVEKIEGKREDGAWPKGRETWRAKTSGGDLDFYAEPGLHHVYRDSVVLRRRSHRIVVY